MSTTERAGGAFAKGECPEDYDERFDDLVLFRADSSLLITIGSIWEVDAGGRESYEPCAIRYYRWTGRELQLIREDPYPGPAAEQRHAPERPHPMSCDTSSGLAGAR